MSENQVSLDKLVEERLAGNVVEDIEEVELFMEDIAVIETPIPSFYFLVTGSLIYVRYSNIFSIKKTLAAIAGIITGVWTIVQFVLPFLSSWTP